MATVVLNGSSSNSEHSVAAVRQEQRAYTFKVAVSMALYVCLFFVLAFCGPYVLPAITLLSDAPLTDRQVAASQLLLLSDTVWVAIPVFFLGAILFSLLATRRIADALERLGRSASAWASGSLSHRFQFREADRLGDLAQLLNQGWTEIGQAIAAVQQESSRAQASLNSAVKALQGQGMGGSDALRQLQTTTESLDRIDVALRRFEIEPLRERR